VAKKRAKKLEPLTGAVLLTQVLSATSRRVLEVTLYRIMMQLYAGEEPETLEPDQPWDSDTIDEVAELVRNLFTEEEFQRIVGEVHS
jgi:hypothetical protein